MAKDMNKSFQMEQDEERLSRMLFNYESTSRTEYQKKDLKKLTTTAYVEKPKIEHEKEIVYPFYVHTMTKWKNCIAPFDLYIHPGPIHGFDPRVGQKPYEALGDPDREEAQKTRPRLVMTPAASLDDIVDPEKRITVMNDMYASTLNRAQRSTAEAAFPVDKNIKAPLADTYAPSRPIDLPKWKPKVVPPEWRMESVSWDLKQRRGYADATAEFWKRSPLRYRVEREN